MEKQGEGDIRKKMAKANEKGGDKLVKQHPYS